MARAKLRGRRSSGEELEKGPGVGNMCKPVAIVYPAFLLKCRFCYFSSRERLKNQETIATENMISYTHRSQEEKVHKEARGSIKRQRE